jgi:hypothetical protein
LFEEVVNIRIAAVCDHSLTSMHYAWIISCKRCPSKS